MCAIPNLYVQAARRRMEAGNGLVLATTQPATVLVSGVPVEQWLDKCRQQAGSGRLTVRVEHEGPTRVLRIRDMADKDAATPLGGKFESKSTKKGMDLDLVLGMTAGLGLSLVNDYLEELLYCRLTAVQLACTRRMGTYAVSGYVMAIQVQLPVFL